jgi:aminotransferase EvaB
LDEHNAIRRGLADHYAECLDGLVLPAVRSGAEHVYHLYVVRHPARDALLEALKAHGVGTLIHYPVPVHRQAAYADLGYGEGSLPVTEQVAKVILSLPMYVGLAEADLNTVGQAVEAGLEEIGFGP